MPDPTLPNRPSTLRRRLLAWYDVHRRDLPWRAPPGQTTEPYRVWLSEIMLQQTTVATVIPYFDNFVARWPTVDALAAASLDDVLHAWQGLGYYARARNLHRCSQVICEDFGGEFPAPENELRSLPGIGDYSAAAIAAIAFDRAAVPVDGNVKRVLARLAAVDEPPGAAKTQIHRLADALVARQRPGDFAQALMDLGATVCTPKNPACGHCPWSRSCIARRDGLTGDLPRKAEKKVRPTRHGIAFWTVRNDGAVLLRRRPPKGLLGGMIEFPSTPWRTKTWGISEASALAPAKRQWRRLPGQVGHTFTHFHLELIVLTAPMDDGGDAEGIWCAPDQFSDYALPTVMKKIARHVAGEN
jgi:A/G-specific adenine glycosylase